MWSHSSSNRFRTADVFRMGCGVVRAGTGDQAEGYWENPVVVAMQVM